jgi:hypothetical protein
MDDQYTLAIIGLIGAIIGAVITIIAEFARTHYYRPILIIKSINKPRGRKEENIIYFEIKIENVGKTAAERCMIWNKSYDKNNKILVDTRLSTSSNVTNEDGTIYPNSYDLKIIGEIDNAPIRQDMCFDIRNDRRECFHFSKFEFPINIEITTYALNMKATKNIFTIDSSFSDMKEKLSEKDKKKFKLAVLKNYFQRITSKNL